RHQRTDEESRDLLRFRDGPVYTFHRRDHAGASHRAAFERTIVVHLRLGYRQYFRDSGADTGAFRSGVGPGGLDGDCDKKVVAGQVAQAFLPVNRNTRQECLGHRTRGHSFEGGSLSLILWLRRGFMFSSKFFKLSLAIAVTALPATLAVFAQQRARNVNDALLRTGSKSGDEWVAYGVNWAEQRYSPLNQINASNISRLGVAWSYDIPLAPGNPQTHQEATPLVVNGVLYSITPWSIVYAVDLKTQKEIWRADPEVNQQV